MRLAALVLGVGFVIGGVSWYLYGAAPGSPPVEQIVRLPQRVKDVLDRVVSERSAQLSAPAAAATSFSASRPSRAPSQASRSGSAPPASTSASAPATTEAAPSANLVTLYLTNGGIVTGELARTTAREVVLRWSYGDVAFRRAEIRRMVLGKQRTGAGGITTPGERSHADGAAVRGHLR